MFSFNAVRHILVGTIPASITKVLEQHAYLILTSSGHTDSSNIHLHVTIMRSIAICTGTNINHKGVGW